MSGELIPVSEIGGVSKYSDEQSFDSVAGSGAFLPRVQLMGSSATLVKEGKINQGHYGLVRGKDQVEDLTKEVAVVVLSWRPKAMEFNNDDGVLSIYNPKSEEFKRISLKSEGSDSGCMYGPEFLVYVPSHKTFATFFMSSKTARREAPQLKGLMGKLANLKSQLIKAKKFAWHGPVVTPCSQPVDLPSREECISQMEKFNNPPEDETEAVPEVNEDR